MTKIISLDSRFILQVNKPKKQLELPSELAAAADAIWDEHKERFKNTLHDSPILSFDRVVENIIEGHFVSYKHFLASRYHAEIRDLLDIKPLGVSGIVLCGENLLLGRRSQQVAFNAGFYELVPSGGVDNEHTKKKCIDYNALILKELHEEALINPKWVKEICPLAFFCLEEEGIYEIAFYMDLHLPPEEQFETRKTVEYDELFWLDFFALPAFSELNSSTFTPLSFDIWKHVVSTHRSKIKSC